MLNPELQIWIQGKELPIRRSLSTRLAAHAPTFFVQQGSRAFWGSGNLLAAPMKHMRQRERERTNTYLYVCVYVYIRTTYVYMYINIFTICVTRHARSPKGAVPSFHTGASKRVLLLALDLWGFGWRTSAGCECLLLADFQIAPFEQ